MALPVPPDITVKLYQLEENIGGTDLQKKSSPAEVTYATAATTTNDFFVKSISGINETLEIDKGVYQIDSVSLVTQGLGETFFNAYGDALNEPYVCEIFDNTDAAVLFHGPIDRTSIKFNPGTGYTSFDVVSWLYVLEQTSAAARYIYDTKMTRRYDGRWDDIRRAVFISKTINGLDMSTVVQPGDVAVFSSGKGEHRIPILAPVVDGLDLVLALLSAPSNLYVTDVTVAVPVKGFTDRGRYLRMDIANSTLYTALQRFHSDSNDDEYDGNKINVFISPNGGAHSGETHIFTGVTDNALAYDSVGSQYFSAIYWKLIEDGTGTNVRISIETTDEDWITDAVAFGVDVDVGTTSSIIDTGGKIRILGREVYGYVELAGFDEIVANMKLQKIIEGMFGLTDLGVMQYIVDTFTYPAGWDPEWDKWLEYPNRLIDSLRMMQDTEYFFLKFTPTLNAGLPRMTLEVIPRNDVNVATLGAATALTGVIEYSEESADRVPRAVIVKPNKNYLLPKAWNHVDHLGFYFSGMPTTAVAIAATQVPEGADVLKFTANWTPTYALTTLWPTNGKSVMLDVVGQNKARRFYEFYENLNRIATFKFNGELSPTLLGNFISVNEGGLTRTIFVTELSRGVLDDVTEVTGLVGEYTESTSSTPVSVITGDLRYTDTDAGGTELISLSGARSYDPDGLVITYEWILDPLGVPSTIGTSVGLNDHVLAVGTHTIRLTVDNGTTTASSDVIIKVIADNTPVPGPVDPEADFQSAPFLTLDASGDVFITVDGDFLTQQTSGGVVVEHSLTSSSGPWTSATGTPFTDPVSLGTVYSALAEDTTLWVRARLLNDADGSTSANEWISQITNTLGSSMTTLTVNGPFVVNIDGIGEVVTDGTEDFSLLNTTLATVGVQQFSPAVRWQGAGWKTDATAASQTVEIRAYVKGVKSSAAPTGFLVFDGSINGGAYAELFNVTTAGQFTIIDQLDVHGTVLTIDAGGLPATAGTIRLPKGANFNVRNAGDTANIEFFGHNGSTDEIFIGSNTGSASIKIRAGGTIGLTLDNSGNGTIAGILNVNGNTFTIDADGIPATTGTIRLPKNSSLSIRNGGNTGNLQVIGHNAGPDDIYLGSDTGSGAVYLRAGGTNGLKIENSGGHTLFFATAKMTASTTARASINIPSGVAPTSPVNGDFWSDGSDLLVRLGGVTYTLNKT